MTIAVKYILTAATVQYKVQETDLPKKEEANSNDRGIQKTNKN